MSAIPIDGRTIAAELEARLRDEAAELASKGTTPKLAGLLVEGNPAAEKYAKVQSRACDRIGIDYRLVTLEASIDLAGFQKAVDDLAEDASVSGILIHRPLPDHLEGDHVPVILPPKRDVEGMHPWNLGRLIYKSGGLPPCTAMAAVHLLESTGIEIEGKEAVVVGHSEIVGKPIALWLLNRLATTTVCHHGTVDLAAHTRRADILFVAVGKPGLITGDMVRPGAVVIDIGINRVKVENEDGSSSMRTVGDVDAASVRDVAGYLTPVPGGVGPVTTAMLMQNTVHAAKRSMETATA